MRFIALLRTSESHGFPPPELHDGIAALSAEAARSGVLVDTAGLLPVATATRVAVSAGRLTVTDGPFDDPAPLGAYVLYDVPTRADAIHWTERFMDLHRQTWPGWEGESEIRQIVGRSW
jgi:hypothetical protein